MNRIKKLPSNVTFDYMDIFGFEHYHSNTRYYVVAHGVAGDVINSYSFPEYRTELSKIYTR